MGIPVKQDFPPAVGEHLVKCRKITHGYCTLKIRIANSNYKYNAHKTTRTFQAREFKFKYKIYESLHMASLLYMH